MPRKNDSSTSAVKTTGIAASWMHGPHSGMVSLFVYVLSTMVIPFLLSLLLSRLIFSPWGWVSESRCIGCWRSLHWLTSWKSSNSNLMVTDMFWESPVNSILHPQSCILEAILFLQLCFCGQQCKSECHCINTIFTHYNNVIFGKLLL